MNRNYRNLTIMLILPVLISCGKKQAGKMNEAKRQIQLPFRKAVQIAWKGIRIRWWRSLLVTSGVILALGFLTYILFSDAMGQGVLKYGSDALKTDLGNRGLLSKLSDADARVQTWWMVGLALLISFVGIINAMVMSVTERFREIGTMKCLGAMDTFIIKLFLLESAFQGLIGTAIGIVIGLLLSYAEGMLTYGSDVWSLLSAADMVRIIGICYLIGTVLTMMGALYPAWRAAKMQPVDAMRSEV